MSLPTNSTFVIEREVQSGNVDGTPTYETQQLGPYKCWYRSLMPTIDGQDAIDVWTKHLATLYIPDPTVPIDQADQIQVTVTGQPTLSFEVETVRQRTGRAGVHHIEALAKRIVEGR